MKTIHIQKAQRTLTDFPVPDTTIVIELEIKDAESLHEAAKAYQADARKLCEALYESLPGGTFDQLLVEMLRRKASHFKVSYK